MVPTPSCWRISRASRRYSRRRRRRARSRCEIRRCRRPSRSCAAAAEHGWDGVDPRSRRAPRSALAEFYPGLDATRQALLRDWLFYLRYRATTPWPKDATDDDAKAARLVRQPLPALRPRFSSGCSDSSRTSSSPPMRCPGRPTAQSVDDVTRQAPGRTVKIGAGKVTRLRRRRFPVRRRFALARGLAGLRGTRRVRDALAPVHLARGDDRPGPAGRPGRCTTRGRITRSRRTRPSRPRSGGTPTPPRTSAAPTRRSTRRTTPPTAPPARSRCSTSRARPPSRPPMRRACRGRTSSSTW